MFSRLLAKKLVLGVVAVQVFALVYMAGEREYVRAYGTRVYLQTAPIDPRDPFRGDYVRLRYSFSTLFNSQLSPVNEVWGAGEQVYAQLKPVGGGRHELDSFAHVPPEQGIYLKGRTTHDYTLARFGAIGVKYGLEQYFVEQGQGLVMEERLGARNEMQVPLEVQVAVGAGGIGVIVDHRWSQLGVKLELKRIQTRNFTGDTDNPEQAASPLVLMSYQNVSNDDLALIDDPDHCSFHLQAVDPARFTAMASEVCNNFVPAEEHFIRLAPGEVHRVEFDLSDARWHVLVDGEEKEIGKLDQNDFFRITYRAEAVEGQAANLWEGSLASPAFTAWGLVD